MRVYIAKAAALLRAAQAAVMKHKALVSMMSASLCDSALNIPIFCGGAAALLGGQAATS